MNSLKVVITRQDGVNQTPYIETFILTRREGMTVTDVLFDIQLNPVNEKGDTVSPVVWECNCLEEVCGACAMNICGKPRMACSTIVNNVAPEGTTLVIEPLLKFPVVRDLTVDRTVMYNTYKRLGLYSTPGEKVKLAKTGWKQLYDYTRCMSCGICREVCPNTGVNSLFSGASGYSVMRSLYETRELDMSAFLQNGGIAQCGGHSLCSKYCPKKIDLPAAISYANRKINGKFLAPKKK